MTPIAAHRNKYSEIKFSGNCLSQCKQLPCDGAGDGSFKCQFLMKFLRKLIANFAAKQS